MRWLMAFLLAACGAQSAAMQKNPKDVDGDGVLDVDDKCAYDPGPAPMGCPPEGGVRDAAPGPAVAPGTPPAPGVPAAPAGKPGDRDGDSVPDAEDRCADAAEDVDSFQDADGCPDPDNDADGKPDASDSCPNEAEDGDKFQDEDGCPDPDNDKDKILDMNDRCPNEAETVNGRADTDGCPDS